MRAKAPIDGDEQVAAMERRGCTCIAEGEANDSGIEFPPIAP